MIQLLVYLGEVGSSVSPLMHMRKTTDFFWRGSGGWTRITLTQLPYRSLEGSTTVVGNGAQITLSTADLFATAEMANHPRSAEAISRGYEPTPC
jgi:hypothetical protein